MDGILVPVHRGEAVSYRRPRWAGHCRDGSIDVPAGCPLLIIEGDGAGRREVAHLIDALIWVQSDEKEAERRNLAPVRPKLASRATYGPRAARAEGVPAPVMRESFPLRAR
jgi:hypothetical protein